MSNPTVPDTAVLHPYLTQPTGRRVASLIGIYAAFVFVIADAVGFSTLLPAATADLGGGELYALASAIGGILGVVAMPVLGHVSTRHPHLRPYLLGGGVLLVAVMLLVRSVAPDMSWVLFACALQTVGGTACIYVVGLPMIRDMFPAQRAGTLLGVVSSVSAVGMIVGPLAVGAIIDTWSWRVVGYVVAVPLAVAAVLVFTGARPKKEETAQFAETDGRVDILGAILLAAFITCLVLPLSLGTGLIPYGSVANTVLLIAAVLSLVALVSVESRKKADAIIPTSALADRNTLMLMIQVFLSQASALIVIVFVPYYILGVMSGSATHAGFAGALYALPALFLGPVMGRRLARTGSAKDIIYVSTVFKLTAMITLTVLMLTQDIVSFWAICACMLVAGTYNGLNQTVLQTGPQLLIAPELRVQGTAAVSMQTVLGPILGAASFGSLVVGLGLMPGIPIAIAAATVAAALTVVPAIFMHRRPAIGDAAGSEWGDEQPGTVMAHQPA